MSKSKKSQHKTSMNEAEWHMPTVDLFRMATKSSSTKLCSLRSARISPSVTLSPSSSATTMIADYFGRSASYVASFYVVSSDGASGESGGSGRSGGNMVSGWNSSDLWRRRYRPLNATFSIHRRVYIHHVSRTDVMRTIRAVLK